jgi:hypothetical protein
MGDMYSAVQKWTVLIQCTVMGNLNVYSAVQKWNVPTDCYR